MQRFLLKDGKFFRTAPTVFDPKLFTTVLVAFWKTSSKTDTGLSVRRSESIKAQCAEIARIGACELGIISSLRQAVDVDVAEGFNWSNWASKDGGYK